MSDFSNLKHEILEWATSNVAMKEFTTHDVYDQVHSALSSEQTSDALRRLYKEGKLNRKEFMDGNRKKFIYSLKEKVNLQPGTWSEIEQIPTKINKIGAIPELSGMSKRPDFPGGAIASINCDNSNKQIEIPNNFEIELRTPSGFVITIKSSDLKEQK